MSRQGSDRMSVTKGTMGDLRRRLTCLVAVALSGLVLLGLTTTAASARTSAGTGTRAEAVNELERTRRTIDETLRLLDAGQRDRAFAQSKAGYLDHFEQVEIPLRIADPELTLQAEETFATIRGLIRSGAPVPAIRAQIVDLRRLIDDAERRLTDKGLGAPLIVAGQAFLILFREGLEAVLLLSVLFGYLESTKNSRYKRPLVYGVVAAGVATAVTFLVINAIVSALPFGREVLEAVVALLAVVVLMYVAFWLLSRLEHRRWLEFLKARVWTAVSAGSTTSLALIGFTSVYREGFETALFFQALTSFGTGLGIWVALGALASLAVLALVAVAVFRLGRRLPLRTFLAAAVVLLMATSVAFLGNAVNSLQEAAVLSFHRLSGWPRLPIFLAQATGYRPTVQTVAAQGVLLALYLAGGAYALGIAPRRLRARGARDVADSTRVPGAVDAPASR
jgi:high-affinity iron transporter